MDNRKWDWKQMEHYFYISKENKANLVWECSLTDIINEDNLHKLITLYGEGIRADNHSVTSMYLAGWFGYLCGWMHFLQSQSQYIQPSYITVQLYRTAKGTMLLSFTINEKHLVPLTNANVLFSFYESVMTPLYIKMSEQFDTNLQHMWYQATHSLYWISHRMIHSTKPLNQKTFVSYEQALETFKNDALPELFGASTKKNPYTKKLIFIDNPWDIQDPLPLKPSCCLAYQTKGGHFCYTCPKMKKTEREKKFHEVMEKHTTTG
ncbi:hypothetical protein FIU87_08170 [Bacillus sp. THAF10]|nr:hypothetical protein FIU87_08170 [Bacillus sp. THAF10]